MRTSAIIVDLELGQPDIIHRPLAAQLAEQKECGAATPLTTARWMRAVIRRVRSGEIAVTEGSAAQVVAQHRDQAGRPLDLRVSAVELINVLRTTVANARYVVFGALALHEHPDCREALQPGDEAAMKTTLVQCAWAGARKKASYLQAQFQRLRHRRGPKKAICAVAPSILTAADHMLRDGSFYQDFGADHFRRAAPEVQANRLARQIAKLGFTCTTLPAAEMEVSV